MPTFNIFGWQKPCYLLQDGYVDTFAELMENTEWERYGTESGNKKCANCMVHSGYEASAVDDTFGSIRGMAATIKGMLFSSHRNKAAAEALEDAGPAAPHASAPVPLTVSWRARNGRCPLNGSRWVMA